METQSGFTQLWFHVQLLVIVDLIFNYAVFLQRALMRLGEATLGLFTSQDGILYQLGEAQINTTMKDPTIKIFSSQHCR